MALTDTLHPESRLRTTARAVLLGLREGFAAYADRRGRVAEINRLNALSDAELAKLGISRERIPHHVFRDLLAI